MKALLRHSVTIFALLLVSAAVAQQCTYEVEPNDLPAQATFISGEGPDAVATALNGGVGTICLAGAIAGSDQDGFIWEVDETAAAQSWQIEIEGPLGGITQIDLVDVEFADNGTDVVRADRLFRFGTNDGYAAVSDHLIVRPGRYLIGISQAGVAGDYNVNLRPTPLAKGRSEFREGPVYKGPFSLLGQLSGGFAIPFTIAEEQAGYVWGVTFQSPVGTAPTLTVEGNGGVIGTVRASGPAPVRLSNLGLAPGEYLATVEPATAEESGLTTVLLEAMGRATDGVEIEPNDRWEDASWFGLGEEVRGVADGSDYFVIEVPAETSSATDGASGGAWDLNLDSETELQLRLYDSDRELLQERRGVKGTTRALHLEPGRYYVLVNGKGDTAYTLSLTATEPSTEGFEREPNDRVSSATTLGPDGQVRGELWAQDVDFFRLEVTGEAQRYRLQVVGKGVEAVGLYDAGGSRLAQATGSGRIRLDDVVLLPGANYLRVSGADGEYALRALSLGPAPEPTPPADAPSKDQPLVAVVVDQPDEQAAEEAVEDPQEAALPPLPPPPPGLLEREPNDDASRAIRLEPGVVHVGRLSADSDSDHYRFHLAADQYVRVELVQAAGETGWAFGLDGRYYYSLPRNSAEPVIAETWLLAGDHRIELAGRWIDETPSDYYQLRLTPLGSLGLPVDLEPNDAPESAALLPFELDWSGRVGEASDYDIYALPVFADETTITLTTDSDDAVKYDLVGERSMGFDVADDGTLTQALPATEQAYLRIYGQGMYHLQLAFSSPPDPAALLPPRTGGELAVELEFAQVDAAAFWHEGQRLSGTLSITNSSASDMTADLSAAADNAAVTIELPTDATVPAGESITLPVSVALPADVSDQAPVAVQVSAAGGRSLAVTGFDLAMSCEAPPIHPFAYSSVPTALAGRPNVLLASLGATQLVVGDAYHRDRWLNDGRTAVSNGAWVSAERVPTFRLAGNEPVTLVGTVLNPATDGPTTEQLKRFRIETSLDGDTYEVAFEGRLSAAKVDQAFVFETPVEARFARLVAVDSHRGRVEGYLGEWKLIADDAALFSGLDIAASKFGGNVVWSNPLLTSDSRETILTTAGNSRGVDLREAESFSMVVGFDNARAALIRSFSWLQADAEAEQLFDSVEVATSLAGAAGPWEVVGEWPLGGATTTAELDLEAPLWARYVRFTLPKREGGRFYVAAKQVSVNEAHVADGYLSALGEWGTNTKIGPYEHLVGFPEEAAVEQTDAGDSAEQATPLVGGDVAVGTVAVAEDVDWYRITVPAGENHLEVRLSGDPAIAYTYELTMADGAPLAFEARSEGDAVVLSAYVDPGDYLLRLEEPKRTVIFSWDTSGSVSPYHPITYSSLASFARGVDGDREAVQLLAFDDPTPKWLLSHWSDDPERVQRAITEWDRGADSSLSEIALLTASEALRGREGTKAILFMTDAETSGYRLTPELWDSLAEVKPRVFTFEISSGGGAYPQDLMQNWANVNAGVYEMASGVGSFDAGFARASCLLRRPKRYTIEVTTAAVAPPGPGTLTVMPSPDAGESGVHVIFDASGSMGQKLPSGEQRIVAAKRALEDLVGAVLEDETPFSLRAFGHVAPNSCETSLDVALGPLDRQAALAAVAEIEPKLLSQTAIADSLLLAIDDLAAAGGRRTVILITDGAESCGGDPAAAAAELRASGDTTIAIVSLALDAEGLAVFAALAEEIDATYVDVGSFEGLREAIAAALHPGFEVYDTAGELVATGLIGQSVELPMGVYRVVVQSAPSEVFDDVRVPGDRSVLVTMRGR